MRIIFSRLKQQVFETVLNSYNLSQYNNAHENAWKFTNSQANNP